MCLHCLPSTVSKQYARCNIVLCLFMPTSDINNQHLPIKGYYMIVTIGIWHYMYYLPSTNAKNKAVHDNMMNMTKIPVIIHYCPVYESNNIYPSVPLSGVLSASLKDNIMISKSKMLLLI